MSWSILEGDALTRLRDLEAGSVQTCVTSPPYWGLRDYGSDGQLGLEPTPEQYVENMVEVFREVRRVLADDGTLWLNLGDCYASAGGTGDTTSGFNERYFGGGSREGKQGQINGQRPMRARAPGLKPKDLVGIPWMVAFALRADGWLLRDEIIWAKGREGQAGMPGSQKDRCTRSHEQIFMLAKQPQYFYDYEAIKDESVSAEQEAHSRRYARVYDGPSTERANGQPGNVNNGGIHSRPGSGGRTKRTVWNVSITPFSDAHFATFPPKLIEPCILAGSVPRHCDWADGGCGSCSHSGAEESHDADCPRVARSTVLDPFAGAGTTGLVALRHNRSFVGIELNPEYAEMARNRIRDDAPIFNVGAEAA